MTYLTPHLLKGAAVIQVEISYYMSRKDDIRTLIVTYNRRLQKLKETKAIKGPSTDPDILIEIEDIKEELVKLQKELEQILEKTSEDFITFSDVSFGDISVQISPNSKARKFFIIVKGVPFEKISFEVLYVWLSFGGLSWKVRSIKDSIELGADGICWITWKPSVENEKHEIIIQGTKSGVARNVVVPKQLLD